jgi:hypothetical protein
MEALIGGGGLVNAAVAMGLHPMQPTFQPAIAMPLVHPDQGHHETHVPHGPVKRVLTAYTKAEQVAAIEHYLTVLKGRDRAALYTWFAVNFRKPLKPGTFSLWLKNKDRIIAQYRADPARTGNRARLRESITNGLGRQLYEWCQTMESQNVVITDAVLLEQARKIVAMMGPGKEKDTLTDRKLFNFSENWLLRWKKAYGYHRSRSATAPPQPAGVQGVAASGLNQHLPVLLASLPPTSIIPHTTGYAEWQPTPNVESAREALRHLQRFLLELRHDEPARAYQATLTHLDAELTKCAHHQSMRR